MIKAIYKGYSQFIEKYLNAFLKWCIIVIFFILTTIVLLQIFFRYVLSESIFWSEEAARYLLIWLVMIAAAHEMSYAEHIKVTFFREKLSLNYKIYKLINIIIYLVLLFVLLVFLKSSYELATRVSRQSSPALRISMLWPYLALPIGGFFMILQVIKLILKTIFSKNQN
ncbi:MAG: TRAP transporter small permease [Halanaerobiales bacterium]